jgi:hypothetical protein
MPDPGMERALELRRLRQELKQCPPGSPERDRWWARIDVLLDQHLEAKGAHPPACGCDACALAVADALARRVVAELVDPRGVATPGQW